MDVCLLQSVRTGSAVHSSASLVGNVGSVAGIKQPVGETDHLPQSSCYLYPICLYDVRRGSSPFTSTKYHFISMWLGIGTGGGHL